MVKPGLDVFLAESGNFKKKRTALIANHTSVTAGLSYSWDEFIKKGIKLERIFSPEHGLFGVEQDQSPAAHSRVGDIPLTSLYGSSFASLSPSPEDIAKIDCFIFDIQDIGSRYYTYAATLILFMQTLSGSSAELIVLDRPNPLGGETVEGPILEDGYESFVGLIPVPVRHGLTMGEIAVFAKERFKSDIDLQVVKMRGWKRNMYFDETGLPWIPPSPNMPSLGSAIVYPGMCLLEGTNISEGRGTTGPFEIFGAPFIDPYKLLAHPDIKRIKGAVLVPFFFRPTFNKYMGETCGGCFIHINSRRDYESFAAGVALVKAVHDIYPRFEFSRGVYEFNSDHPAFDLLCGSSRIRGMILEGASIDEIMASWKAEQETAARQMMNYHIY
jgi:uncharacterized protein YbbC (DUF1343 family)